ncbi:MAG TPA: HAD-IIIC family phosphatase [Methylocella sp.]|nr:HAD-IIIC family phosphatase [Methylocella sp.]
MQSTALRAPMMSWLPIPVDFRADLRAALQADDASRCLENLARLSGYQLGFLETLQLDRAISELGLKEASGFVPIRLAILASSTVDHLPPAIRVAGLRRKLLIDVHSGAYGQYRQDLLDPTTSLHQFSPQTVLFSLTAREILSDVPVTAAVSDVDEAINRSIDELRLLWGKAHETFNAAIIQQTFVDVAEPLFGSYDRFVPGAPSRLVAELNDRLTEAAARDGVLLLDIGRASARDGIDAWFDTGRWLQGKLEIAPQAAPLYGEMTARILAAQRGLSKKCLVLDLDNTLWGGVIGDDGIEGIVLGEGSAAGEAHLALQRYAKQLKERGVILAICSKNDPAIAEAAFQKHPEMLLRQPDIAAFLANWDDKTKNLKAIAARLNIGIDSLVFVDDNPVERARVRQSLPMIAVPELPDDPAQYVRCLGDASYFEAVAFTSEDRHRARQYAANAEREALLESAQSMDEFLRGLKMSVVFGPFTAVDHARIVQLFNKTNQFNTTTRRYTSEEIASIANLPNALTLQFRLLDRIGDNGLVSAMILRPAPAQEDVFEIENWVMSCRVFGRQLEFEAMNIAVEVARQRGARALIADYIATPKNNVISALYLSLGFAPINEPAPANGAMRWFLDFSDYVTRDTHIVHAGAAG